MRGIRQQQLRHQHQVLGHTQALTVSHVIRTVLGLEALVEVVLPQQGLEDVLVLVDGLVSPLSFLLDCFLFILVEPLALDLRLRLGFFNSKEFEKSAHPRSFLGLHEGNGRVVSLVGSLRVLKFDDLRHRDLRVVGCEVLLGLEVFAAFGADQTAHRASETVAELVHF